ncbi:MAG: hypothetical protein D3925_18440 [Candidatus Electrothrix sp. AR5]|nr:hypothetical protein [Candidatus Electrothrix sp. AR5]
MPREKDKIYRNILLLLLVACSLSAQAKDVPLPPEVSGFIHERDLCDHFRGEPYEGDSPEQIKRREFIFESMDIYCAGTDRRLAALKRRYKDDAESMALLKKYEEKIE